MRTIKGLLAGLLLGVAGSAAASEPMQLAPQQLDAVSAGLFNVDADAFTIPSFAVGNSIQFGELAQSATLSQTVLTPGTFGGNFAAVATSQVFLKSAGTGLTGTSGGGGVFTSIFAN